ncbi:MAG: carboxylating nicotinate-nucleotide diphosphorylase [Deltaproteobacteria bacterium]
MPQVDKLIDLAIAEDIGSGDITTDSLVPSDLAGKAVILAKEPLVLAGLETARQVFARFDGQTVFETTKADGDQVETNETFINLEGRLAALLKAERIALNFLQRLSGIATHVRAYVDAMGDSPIRLVDTRKTTPGWRVLEKYAVRMGGGANHRMGLYDGVLIKDNHIAACGGVKPAIERARQDISHLIKIEVEVSSLEEARQAIEAGAEVIMLDNMSLGEIRQAKAMIGQSALVEVSGNVTMDRLKELAETNVDLISIGALTHAARSVDISMRISR